MKTALVLVSMLASLSVASTGLAQTIVLNGVNDCGGNPTNPANGQIFSLDAGTHSVDWISGAYSLWSSNGQNGGLTWVALVRMYIYATDETVTIGNPGGPFFSTPAAAEAGALGTYNLVLSTASNVAFYLSDGGGCGDNRGNITLQLSTPVAVDESPWSAIKRLYR